ncbi:S41 family peptidase [Sediminicola luteus]|uniref:Tail specific protease domain-containing protein n=1 Tax=Sediminicola luteus TaxID=319238 RepID=A0A2A4G7W2_9FLAO|nr:S41 family peptidase [Sediminicola luteus]PCE64068.1 hypothetical protein B7P33_12575 [Sediminicola luteus]
MNRVYSSILVLGCLLLGTLSSKAQEQAPSITPKQTQKVIDSVESILKARYVFPEMAQKMGDLIQSNKKKGTYEGLTDPQLLAAQLTEDLQSISKDKHLRVMYNPRRAAAQGRQVTPEDSIRHTESRMARMKFENFGFKEVKILEGNIGYLDLRAFMDTEFASETAVAAMNLLANTDVIIIDLRQNGGGSPSMIQLISSYLYSPERVHLNNFYWRPTDSHTQTWTLPHVPGKRNPDAKVYVLTSSSTFSAAEEFSYNLKNLERATLIGETTGGGAHPGGTVNASEGFLLWTPAGRAINPITETNWEGTGVSPHIEVPADQALEVAQTQALEYLANKTTDPHLQFRYNWVLSGKKAKTDPVQLSKSTLKQYVGQYDVRKISMENGTLFYQREGRPKHALTPLNETEFLVGDMDDFRVRFDQKGGQVNAIVGMYANGRTDKNPKTD